MVQLTQKTSAQIALEIAQKIKTLRKLKGLTQNQLALKSGVSFASYKRFEQQHEISFDSLIKIAIALDIEKDFDLLFQKKEYSSIQEVIALQKRNK